LKKLFGAEFFNGSIRHLIHHEAILPTSLDELNLSFIVQIVTPAFSRCWALIALALVIHF
jgi:hypothetical protein